ncbi:MAG: 2-succinyl-6-hydroxy-2 4-cyclohexadiene-1-carboxylic acid synthase/2-oxoglutarate decarboxylase [Ignavibacteria bacterium]|nr:MAG: 2-succinyl-6-hydroxy-2 4-cyclohexadiene-1-carboxylic acid synthase/2-oxoglutarate decarboxylase [Ignavibacteria bacterium]KAF0160820.1 MAG: 2-succinyl-6-hydroxy-2 4-cyclohexadiene-1-carboxylic acid synthase/2-oxoglutarate decarboxylase [Ignavibacteria bacterium]
MKLSINRNIIWCDVFTNRLSELGVKHVCISPGSRSTPLTLSFASTKLFTIYPIVDERSSAFFALGLAKKYKSPVAIVTTSGTAVAELYPAIIEAFYQRIPLIICTADRPRKLRGSGANQTINQNNIYKNHIRMFEDVGLPDLKNISVVKKYAEEAVRVSFFKNRGPVHLNFQFEKPFEPNSATDTVDVTLLENIYAPTFFELKETQSTQIDFERLAKKLFDKRGLMLIGFNSYGEGFAKQVMRFSESFGFPVYVDGSSSLRFGSHRKDNIIENFTAIVRAKDFQENYDPELIIQFGSAPTANVILEFFKNSKAEKILCNEFGDLNDPSLTAKKIIRMNPEFFCESICNTVAQKKYSPEWLDDWRALNATAAILKEELIENSSFPFEGRIPSEIVACLPDKSNLFVSNSLPIRDFDFFASTHNKRLNIFTNRGASGIDGIISTALGIAKASKEPTFLVTGDLAFFHDMNGLHNSIKFKIPITIILINNGGGGIFESLPISEYREVMKDNFLTPLNINFKKFVEAYGGKHVKIKSWNHLRKELKLSSISRKLAVLEVITDAKKSKLIRQKYWSAVIKQINLYIKGASKNNNFLGALYVFFAFFA